MVWETTYEAEKLCLSRVFCSILCDQLAVKSDPSSFGSCHHGPSVPIIHGASPFYRAGICLLPLRRYACCQ